MTQPPLQPNEMTSPTAGSPSDGRIRPAGWWFIVGALMIVVGLGAPITMITFWGLSIAGEMEELEEVQVVEIDVPGQADFQLSKTGDYNIFYNFNIDVAGRPYRTDPQLPGLTGVLSDRETGERVLLKPAISRSRTDLRRGGRAFDDSRALIWEFHADRGGTFTIDVAYPDGTEGPGRIVLVVERQVGEMAMSKVSSMCFVFPLAGLVALAGVIGGVAMLVVVGVRRSSCKRKLAARGRQQSAC